MIHKPSSQIEADLARKDGIILRVAEATHHLATELSRAHQSFWAIPTERLLAVLNANVAETVQAFEANTALATACNASLDALDLPEMSARAPLLPGRSDIVFENGAFVQIEE